jgi:hypothetical protein
MPAPQMLAEKLAARHCPGRRRTCVPLTVRILLRKLPVLRLSPDAISLLCNPSTIGVLERIPQLPPDAFEIVTVQFALSSSDPHSTQDNRGQRHSGSDQTIPSLHAASLILSSSLAMGTVISYHVRNLILKQGIFVRKSMKRCICTVKLEIVGRTNRSMSFIAHSIATFELTGADGPDF